MQRLNNEGIHGSKSIQYSNRTVQPDVRYMVRTKLYNEPIQEGSSFFNQPICNLQPATCSLQTFKRKFLHMFCIMSINICIKVNKWLPLQLSTNPTLVTPMKNNAYYGRQTYSGNIQSGRATSAILGQVTSHEVYTR
jgi:hypothetical protein